MPDLPTGTLTFLFTDIEGSTERWEQEPERMALAVAAHDRLLRGAVEFHHGRVIKTTGDGIYAAFHDAVDSVAAAIAIQTALAQPSATAGIPLSVRCGIHAGDAQWRDNDFFGSTINRAARVMGLAYGGQVLLSQAVANLLEGRLLEGIVLRDLGEVRLKGLVGTEQVYQLVHPRLRESFPALRSLETTPNNLTQQLTTFIGRKQELADADELLNASRLLTLVGVGGLGKTRLSQQIAANRLTDHPDGVWFVDLAPIKDPTLVPDTAAQVLNLRQDPGKSMTQTVCAYLKSLKTLIVLDNCEHVVGACAEFANALLRAAPEVRIIATTREALNVPGEQTYPLLPLTVPDRAAHVEQLARCEAVQLFVDRARLQKPHFTLTDKDAPAVADLCVRLEGIPLALELAAARMRSMSIQDISKRLNDRFKLLTTGGRALLERPQTLRALVEWSYELLNESERWLFERLSIFSGGFDLEAAEAVCGAVPLTREHVFDLLTSLVAKSLVMVDEGDFGTRYRQLETIRQFGQEYLAKRDDGTVIAIRHCEHYLALAKTARKHLEQAGQAEWMRRIEADLDNMRAGIALALAGGVDATLGVKFEVALMRFRILRGYLTEGRNNVRAALGLPQMHDQDVARGHALYVGGTLAVRQGDHAEATRMLRDSLSIREKLGQSLEVAGTLSTLGVVHLHTGDVEEARKCEEQCLAMFRQLNNPIGEALALGHLGEISMQLGEDIEAGQAFAQCLAIATKIKHRELEAECERYLGELVLDAGDLDSAHARFARSLEISRSAEDKRNEAMALWCLGKYERARGHLDLAQREIANALRAFDGFQMTSEALYGLQDYAGLLRHTERCADAVQLLAAVAAIREQYSMPFPKRGTSAREATVQDLRATLGTRDFESAWATGSGLGLHDAIQYALLSAAATSVTS